MIKIWFKAKLLYVMELMKEYKSKWHMIIFFVFFHKSLGEHRKDSWEHRGKWDYINIIWKYCGSPACTDCSLQKPYSLCQWQPGKKKSKSQWLFTYFQISNNINITTVVYAEIFHLNKIALNYVQLCLSVPLFLKHHKQIILFPRIDHKYFYKISKTEIKLLFLFLTI